MKKNVLIFSSATYPAMQIIDCLKNSPRFHVIAASSYPNHSEFVCKDTVIDLPFVYESSFFQKFIEFVKGKNIDFIIPTDETIAMLLKEHETDIPAIIVCSPYETTKLCRYKKQAYKVLCGENYTPKVYDNIDAITEYPVFVKPDSSQGSKGARIVDSKEELLCLDDLKDLVICEYLPGEEYTVDCFTDKNRKLIFCNPRVRTRLMNGITARGNNIPLTQEFKNVIDGINSKILFRGYWYVQLKRDSNGNLKLLEICSRFAGTFAISKGLGVNLPLLAICDFSNLPTDVIVNDYVVTCDKTYIDRYHIDIDYKHVYIDYDDTITSNEGKSVNPKVIAYLYQCRNKGIKITVITRHQDTFNETLLESFRKLAINKDLFNECIELQWDQNKEDFVKDSNAIFIDNSFSERKKIHDKCRIPVFDVCNIECLFDWTD